MDTHGFRQGMSLQSLIESLPPHLRQYLSIIGSVDITIRDANPLQNAQDGELTLVDSPKHHDRLRKAHAIAVVTPEPIENSSLTQIITPQAHLVFEQLVAKFRPSFSQPQPGIHRFAHIDPSATIGRDAWIAEGASIGRNCHIGNGCRIHRGVHIMDDCSLGDDCELFPAVVLYPNTQLGHRVLVHANATLGAYGFGYRQHQGRHVRTAQMGYVLIENDVEIGAGTTIDRGTYGPTRIGEGTKIDNQVMIGHNCTIGKHNLICAQVGIAGSSSSGDYVVMGGQVGLRDHIHVGDRVMLAAQSGVANDVPDGEIWMGAPAMPQKKFIQMTILQAKLPELRTQLKQIEKTIASLNPSLPTTNSPPASLSDSTQVNDRKAA